MIKFKLDVAASLWKEVYGLIGPNKLALAYTKEVLRGSLRQCITAFHEKPESQKRRYSILLKERIQGKSCLDWRDIEQLVEIESQSAWIEIEYLLGNCPLHKLGPFYWKPNSHTSECLLLAQTALQSDVRRRATPQRPHADTVRILTVGGEEICRCDLSRQCRHS